jgi:hypothetical protein
MLKLISSPCALRAILIRSANDDNDPCAQHDPLQDDKRKGLLLDVFSSTIVFFFLAFLITDLFIIISSPSIVKLTNTVVVVRRGRRKNDVMKKAMYNTIQYVEILLDIFVININDNNDNDNNDNNVEHFRTCGKCWLRDFVK